MAVTCEIHRLQVISYVNSSACNLEMGYIYVCNANDLVILEVLVMVTANLSKNAGLPHFVIWSAKSVKLRKDQNDM